MMVGLDFGITNTDIVIWDENKQKFFSLPTEEINQYFLRKIFNFIKIDLSKVEKIAVTGGKSSDLEDTFNNIPIKKVNEVMAIGYGAKEIYDIKDSSFIVISAGTGTGCIGFMNNEFYYLGGISVGGGTLQGLSSLMIDTNKAKEINDLAIKGDKDKLDSLIGEVVNNIGSLNPKITASNFLKARDFSNQSNEDIASSLANMVGEIIGTISYLNALLIGVKKVYFLGRVSLLESVRKGIDERLQLAGVSAEYSNKREYGNAIGAIAYLHANP
tara:strand:- start:2878 stop:3693 length:816 start_codon:yes stop_codon:yes gene_type:complete